MSLVSPIEPVAGRRIIPEARTVGSTRRLDFLFTSSDEDAPRYGFELLAHGSRAAFNEHLLRGSLYSFQHASNGGCTTFVINMCMEGGPGCVRYYGAQAHAGVVPLHVVLDVPKRTAQLHRDGQPMLQLQLIGDDGELRFDSLVDD